jgi:predicted phage terminase large subunit-like protein
MMMNKPDFENVIRENPRLRKLLQPRMTRYIKTMPTPKQAAFLCLDHVLDAFYGGAAGGGKSEAILMGALQYVDYSDYAALIVRNTFQDLSKPGALMDRAREWLHGTDAKWNDQTKTWTFPSGAKLVFGYLDGPDDHLKYKSSEFQYIGVDEASDLRWNQVLYLFSRLRRNAGSNVPLRFRVASNPGGKSHNDLKERYIEPKSRGKRVFISARMNDNPHLIAHEYRANLQELDSVTRAWLEDGNWDADIDGVWFQKHWFPIVPETALPYGLQWRRFWDLAASKPKRGQDPDWTAGPKLAFHKPTGITYIGDVPRYQVEPNKLDDIIKTTAQQDGKGTWIYMEQEPGASGKIVINHYRDLLRGWVFKGVPSTGKKEEYVRPLCGPAERHEIVLVRGPWNKTFIDEATMFPVGDHDDQIDAAAKCYATWFPVKRKRIGTW